MSKLILTSEVSGLGSAGDVVDVKNGYARNYLIPQGFAIAWSKGAEKQVDSIKASRAAKELATLEEAQALKAKLEAAVVKLAVKAGREGRLFGSVKTADVADAVKAAGLGDVDKRSIELSAPVKSLGRHDATVRLRSDVLAALTLDVVAAK
jgi:large subunit ribosomal protein L9